jgi:hypothetical protein
MSNETAANIIAQKLDQLANYQAQKDYFALHKQELIDQVLTPEIKARLDEIEVEFADRLQAANDHIAALEEEIKQDVLRHGASIKGAFLRAVWNKGRVTWDTRALDEFAITHPEVSSYRKQGEPFIRISKVE